jgi:lipopolysaccharide transport system permease protein
MAVSFKRDGVELSAHSIQPMLVLSSAWRHRELIGHLVKREILSRYRGSFFGIFWSFLQPLIMLAVYTVVLGYFLHARWPGTQNSFDYSLILFSGLILFNFFAECISRAPNLVVANPNYVKKIVFPLEILPWVIVIAGLFHMVLSLIAWGVFNLLVHHEIHWTVLFLPVLICPLALIALGVCWFLCAAGVFFRDVGQIVTPLLQALMFLSPLFYSINGFPPLIQKLLMVNPLTYVVEQARSVMIQGAMPGRGIGLYWLVSFVVAWLGFAWFQHTRDGFADVL